MKEDSLDPLLLENLRSVLKNRDKTSQEEVCPLSDFEEVSLEQMKMHQEKVLNAACLILAGGQGSRLKFSGPKGCFPFLPNKTLFALYAEKIRKKGDMKKQNLHLIIMTSPLNDQATQDHFRENNFFGLPQENVFFYQQGVLPFLDDEGNPFYETKNTLAQGPSGNGLALIDFYTSGIFDVLKKQGVKTLFVMPVENPLADPFDPILGSAIESIDIGIKCIKRQEAKESVGVLATVGGKVRVVEYTEIPLSMREDLHSFPLANIGLFAFSFAFIEQLVKHQDKFPLHLAYKAVKRWKEGRQEEIKAWKFEYFIFDALQFAEKVKVLVYRREVTYSPLKNFSGEASPLVALKDYEKKELLLRIDAN